MDGGVAGFHGPGWFRPGGATQDNALPFPQQRMVYPDGYRRSCWKPPKSCFPWLSFDPDPSAPPHCDAGDRLDARMAYDPATRAEAGRTGLWHVDKASAEIEVPERSDASEPLKMASGWPLPAARERNWPSHFGFEPRWSGCGAGHSAKPGRMRVGQSQILKTTSTNRSE